MEKNTGSGDTELIEIGKVFKTYEEKASEEALPLTILCSKLVEKKQFQN